jgi:putative Mg2+ transporter-C (MgtC) family protein
MSIFNAMLSAGAQPHSWLDVSIRLSLTIIAGALLGFNRQARGHAAGLRTTILVGLAAAIANIFAGLLLSTAGKPADGFAVLDVARLPLGILTGVGFIGGGAILRKGELVRGVTTAATLWITTVIGLCFGGGELGLGIAGTTAGLCTLCGLKWIDLRIQRKQHGLLVLQAEPGFSLDQLNQLLRPGGYHLSFRKDARVRDTRQLTFEVTWHEADIHRHDLDLTTRLGERYNVVSFEITSEMF